MRRLAAEKKVLALTLVTFIAVLTGCASPPVNTRLNQASAAYNQGEYQHTFELATQITKAYGPPRGDGAAYLAGLAAQHLGHRATAVRYLRRAARSDNPRLAGDAAATLGLLYAQQGRYRDSANLMAQAASQLTGDNQAHAYFYLAVAQQKLGLWTQARSNLVLARSKTDSVSLGEQIDQQMSVIGYTIQTGAFQKRVNARRAAKELARKTRSMSIGVPRLVRYTSRAGDSFTLVQIGRFATFQSARRARQKLHDDSTIIVPMAK